jgi:hypothetical protein
MAGEEGVSILLLLLLLLLLPVCSGRTGWAFFFFFFFFFYVTFWIWLKVLACTKTLQWVFSLHIKRCKHEPPPPPWWWWLTANQLHFVATQQLVAFWACFLSFVMDTR